MSSHDTGESQMRALYTFLLSSLTIPLAFACSSNDATAPGPSANDAGTSADGAVSPNDPCFVPFGEGENFIGNAKYKTLSPQANADLDLQWRLQTYNDVLMSLERRVSPVNLPNAMYLACKKLAEDYGASGNEIAHAADEATDALKLKKTCALALDYVRKNYDVNVERPRNVTPYTCVTRISDADACMKSRGATGAGATCRSAADSTSTPLVNGECANGFLETQTSCDAFPLVKMTCQNNGVGEGTPTYIAPATAPGKNNAPVLEFLKNNAFFIPWNDTAGVSRAEYYQRFFSDGRALVFGPPDAKPSCGQRLNVQIGTRVAAFFEMVAFVKELRTYLGIL